MFTQAHYRTDLDFETPAQQGLTLIELMVSLSVVAIFSAIAAPYFRDLMLANQVSNNTNTLVTATHVARIEAIKRVRSVRVSTLDSSPPAGNEWGPGMVVYIDNDDSGTFNAGDEEIRTIAALADTRTINGPNGVTSFDFLPNGGINSTSMPMTFQFCDDRTGEDGRSVSVSTRGQIRTVDYSCS